MSGVASTSCQRYERVQKFAFRICLNKWELDYSSLLLMSNLPIYSSKSSEIYTITLLSQKSVYSSNTHLSIHLYQIHVPFCRTNACSSWVRISPGQLFLFPWKERAALGVVYFFVVPLPFYLVVFQCILLYPRHAQI